MVDTAVGAESGSVSTTESTITSTGGTPTAPDDLGYLTGARATVAMRDAGGGVLASLTHVSALSWRDEHNGNGVGNLTVLEGDPALSAGLDEIALGRIAEVSVDGLPVFRFIVERRSRNLTMDEGVEGTEIALSGRGTRALADAALVYPEYGLTRRSPRERFFNYVSKDYWGRENETWETVTNLGAVSVGWAGRTDGIFPVGWPEVAADVQWMGHPSVGSGGGKTPGLIYFRDTFVLDAAKDVVAFATADDAFELWIDGEKVLMGDNWRQTFNVQYILDAGVHTIAMRVSNWDRPLLASNATGAAFCICTLDPLGVPIDVLAASGSGSVPQGGPGFVSVAYPDPPPAFKPGEVLRLLWDEGLARGAAACSELDLSFAEETDSYGAAWDSRFEQAFAIGTDYLSVIDQLIEACKVDVWIDHQTGALKMANERGTDRSGVILDAAQGTDRIGKLANLTDVDYREEGPVRNTALGGFLDGWTERQRQPLPAVTAGYGGRREVFLSLGNATSDVQVNRVATSVFDELANPVSTLTCSFIAKQGANPYVDFDIGDTISINHRLGTEARRLLSLSVRMLDSGVLLWTAEFAKAPALGTTDVTTGGQSGGVTVGPT